MIKELKYYQLNAIDELLRKADLLINEEKNQKTIVFQSPTGSGKTLMMSSFIEDFIEDQNEREICFLWMSIGKGNLEEQSYKSLKNEFNGFPTVHLLEQEFTGGRWNINKNEVVVANWEKLRTKNKQTGEWINVSMKDKETTNFRDLVRNTQKAEILLVLIIDESHTDASSERAKELREIIDADLTIEMSATPVLKDQQERVCIEPGKVIEEGMIKKEIIINEGVDEIIEDEMNSQDLIMTAAYNKRERLKNLFAKEGLDINPLVLIQLPKGEEAENKRERIEKFLAEKEIFSDVQDGRLAIWLSEEKVNTESYNLMKNNSKVEFLIFKQAINTGWDCPRAAILVQLRESDNITFKIQTIGRILRMPEAEHYQNDELNKAYIFTNVKSFDVIKEEYDPNIIKSLKGERNRNLYSPIRLRSYFRNKIDSGDVTIWSFKDTFDKEICKCFGLTLNVYGALHTKKIRDKIKKKISLENKDNYQDKIILNKTIDVKMIDELKESSIYGEDENLFEDNSLVQTYLSVEDMEEKFHKLIEDNLNGFNYKKTIGTFKNVLYSWFKRYLDIDINDNGLIYIQNIIINNSQFFSQLFNDITLKYKEIKEKEIEEKTKKMDVWNHNWEIPEICYFNPNTYKKATYKKSLYEYFNVDSEIEKDFALFLDKQDCVQWWWQNGNEHMQLNFGIKYSIKSSFQPDFLVLFKDNRLGIFDTKSKNQFLNDTKEIAKAKALQQYIQEENTNNKNLFGGIVIKEGKHFKINSQNNFDVNNSGDWEYITNIVN